jgi:hypothetical protein
VQKKYLQQQTDLSSNELPQGLVGLLHYCNATAMSIGTAGFLRGSGFRNKMQLGLFDNTGILIYKLLQASESQP